MILLLLVSYLNQTLFHFLKNNSHSKSRNASISFSIISLIDLNLLMWLRKQLAVALTISLEDTTTEFVVSTIMELVVNLIMAVIEEMVKEEAEVVEEAIDQSVKSVVQWVTWFLSVTLEFNNGGHGRNTNIIPVKQYFI